MRSVTPLHLEINTTFSLTLFKANTSTKVVDRQQLSPTSAGTFGQMLSLVAGLYDAIIQTENVNGASSSNSTGLISGVGVAPTAAPIIRDTTGNATGAMLRVQRPDGINNELAPKVVYYVQAYSGSTRMGSERQLDPTNSVTGALGSEHTLFYAQAEGVSWRFKVAAAVGGVRAPESAFSSALVIGEWVGM